MVNADLSASMRTLFSGSQAAPTRYNPRARIPGPPFSTSSISFCPNLNRKLQRLYYQNFLIFQSLALKLYPLGIVKLICFTCIRVPAHETIFHILLHSCTLWQLRNLRVQKVRSTNKLLVVLLAENKLKFLEEH